VSDCFVAGRASKPGKAAGGFFDRVISVFVFSDESFPGQSKSSSSRIIFKLSVGFYIGSAT